MRVSCFIAVILFASSTLLGQVRNGQVAGTKKVWIGKRLTRQLFGCKKSEGPIAKWKARRLIRKARRHPVAIPQTGEVRQLTYSYTPGLFTDGIVHRIIGLYGSLETKESKPQAHMLYQPLAYPEKKVGLCVNYKAWPSVGFTDIDYNLLLLENVYIAPDNSDISLLAEFNKPRTFVKDPYSSQGTAYDRLTFVPFGYRMLVPQFQAGIRYWLR